MKQIKLKVITPEKLVLEESVDRVTLPTSEGEITVLPMHIPLVARLKSGDVIGIVKGDRIPLAVTGGFVEVKKNEEGETHVIVLADFAEHVSALTDEVIEQAKIRADELRKQKENNEVIDFEHFESELERSITRIKIADKWRTRKYRK